MIPITEPFLPPIDSYKKHLEEIWERNRLTNNGPLVRELEERLKERFDIGHMLYVSSGTTALQIAIKALDLEGEIITTPFSYIATTSSIVWENCRPVFVDIDPVTLNLDATKIEDAITDRTSGIIATHVFGIPCNIENIEKIAGKHKLKVIFDAAHCFGTRYQGESIHKKGDISITSFHATKLFQTIEGGGIFTNSAKLAEKVDYMRNFGHDGFGKFNGVGINGKNSEFHAAMGLCNLGFIDEIQKTRKKQCQYYDEVLSDEDLFIPRFPANSEVFLSYYPAVFKCETVTLEIKKALECEGIATRRYFYPSLNTLDYVPYSRTPIAEDIASRVLCLPLYHRLSFSEQKRIAGIINKNLKK